MNNQEMKEIIEKAIKKWKDLYNISKVMGLSGYDSQSLRGFMKNSKTPTKRVQKQIEWLKNKV